MLIRSALYRGKAVGRDFINNVCECMRHLNFESFPEDPGVCMIPAMKAVGSYYYDVLMISGKIDCVRREQIGKYFELYEESIGPPKIDLSRRLCKVDLEMVSIHGHLVIPNMSGPSFIMWKGT